MTVHIRHRAHAAAVRLAAHVRRGGGSSVSGVADRGSATVELTLIAPALLLLLAAIVLAGRVALAGGAVEQAAAAGARAASLARNPTTATTAARAAVRAALAGQDLRCQKVTVTIDTAGYTVPLGQPAAVAVRVDCVVRLADLSLPGVPGSRTVTATTTSPLDPNRGRTSSGGGP
jgi:Flp pilus assembly protein TadG